MLLLCRCRARARMPGRPPCHRHKSATNMKAQTNSQQRCIIQHGQQQLLPGPTTHPTLVTATTSPDSTCVGWCKPAAAAAAAAPASLLRLAPASRRVSQVSCLLCDVVSACQRRPSSPLQIKQQSLGSELPPLPILAGQPACGPSHSQLGTSEQRPVRRCDLCSGCAPAAPTRGSPESELALQAHPLTGAATSGDS